MAKHKAAPAAPTAKPEGYTVLARRYRPQHFAELIGQEHVARALENALKSGRVAHAYLFTGARGVGKTSAARILAKCLNCEKGPTTTPCDACPICTGIAAGEDVDVLEIDAASNRGIDNIREVRSNVQFRPARARYKIYIIDEVHMLSREAFNALLKTLEEPPPHVKFIFATTEVQKIPITILSRCQRFDFAGIGTARIKDRLADIVAREKMTADDEALELVARRAGGSMRDAQSLLDQLLAFGSDRLTAEQVHTLLGTAGDDRIVELAGAVLERDAPRALELVARLSERSLQYGELLDQLMAYWRDLMVVHCAGEQAPDLSVPPRHRETVTRQAKALALDTILAGLDVLNNARGRLRVTSHGRLVVEMALVRLTRLEDLVSLPQVAQWLTQGAGSQPNTGATPSRLTAPPEGGKKNLIEVNGTASASLPLTAESLSAVWPQVLASVGPMFALRLKNAGLPAISGPNTLVLRFPPVYNQDSDYFGDVSRVERVEQALQKVTGQGWRVRVEAAPTGPAEPVPPTATTLSPMQKAQKQREAVEALPLFRRAIEVLGAQVVRVDEEFDAGTGLIRPPANDVPEAGEEA